MSRLPRAVSNLIEAFERLPGIGPRTAQRLVFYLLHVPEHEIKKFSEALVALKTGTVKCSKCFNISEEDPCPICSDEGRDTSRILVVEQPIDVLHFERTGKYDGLYHVLYGRIDPLNNISAEDIYIPQLLERIDGHIQRLALDKAVDKGWLVEVILALSPDMEGEATAMYIQKKLKAQSTKHKTARDQSIKASKHQSGQRSKIKGQLLKVTRLAYGLPVGSSVEFSDEVTLGHALEGRREL